jgi:hypothetical protein
MRRKVSFLAIGFWERKILKKVSSLFSAGSLNLKGFSVLDYSLRDPFPEIVFHILKKRIPNYDLRADYFDRLNLKYITNHLIKRLNGLGY